MSGRSGSDSRGGRGRGAKSGRGRGRTSNRSGGSGRETRKRTVDGEYKKMISFKTDILDMRRDLANKAAKDWPLIMDVFTRGSYVYDDPPTRDGIRRLVRAAEDRNIERISGNAHGAMFRSELRNIFGDNDHLYMNADHDDEQPAGDAEEAQGFGHVAPGVEVNPGQVHDQSSQTLRGSSVTTRARSAQSADGDAQSAQGSKRTQSASTQRASETQSASSQRASETQSASSHRATGGQPAPDYRGQEVLHGAQRAQFGARAEQAFGEDVYEGVISKLLTSKLSAYIERNQDMERQKRQAYSYVWDMCDEAVRSACMADRDFKYTQCDQDILVLMNLLHVIIAGEGQSDKAVRRFKAEEAFRNLRKHPDDSLNQFKEKFDLAVERLRLADVNKPEEDLAFAFLQKLDSTFNQLRVNQARTGEFLGAGIRGRKYETVEEAFAGAQIEEMAYRDSRQTRMSSSTRSGNRYGLSFVGRSTRGRVKGRGGGAKGKGSDTEADGKDKSKARSDSEVECYYCKGKGHRKSECTSKADSEIICFGCGGVGHYKNQCPSEPVGEEADKS